MSHKTQFAGLTAPDEGDPPLLVDDGSFVTRNPDTTDYFLRIGALTHVHDAHPALADPIVAASAVVATTGGNVPAGRDLYLGFTLLDKHGGETRLSPVVVASTPPPLPDPGTAITAAYASGVGDMVVGTYYYAVTLVDDAGGETALGPATFIERPPGDTFGRINLSGLAAELGPDAANHWRLWRADNGGEFHIIATGTTNTFTDSGINPTDLAAAPPVVSTTTRATNKLTVTLPAAADEPGLAPAGLGSGFALYISDDGAFGSPALYGAWPVASAGTAIVITDLALLTGAPPDVSTSIPGAHKITMAELASDVTAAIAAGGGGGGGALGPLALGASIIWRDPSDTTATASAVMLRAEAQDLDAAGGLVLDSNTYHAGDYNPDPSLFDIGQPPTDFGGANSYLRPKAAVASAADAHGWIGGASQRMSAEGWIEVGATIDAAGWERVGCGWGGDNANPNVGIFGMIDRAANKLQLVIRNSPADPYTLLASVALPAIAVGAFPKVRLKRVPSSTTGSYDFTLDLTLGKAVAAEVLYTGSLSGNLERGQMVLGWSDPAAIGVEYVTMTRTGTRRRLMMVVAEKHGQTWERLLMDDTERSFPSDVSYYPPLTVDQAAGSVAADGTALVGCTVVKEAAGRYRVRFHTPINVENGVPIIVTDPGGGTLSNIGALGFTVAFGADTAFRFIAMPGV